MSRTRAAGRSSSLAGLGFPDANLSSVLGIFAPGRTPKAILARINDAFNKALSTPAIRHRLDATNNVPTGGTPEDFAAQIK